MHKKLVEEYCKKLEGKKVVSFDVFDTLLFRMVNHPLDIFRIMENVLRIDDFAKLRDEMQMAASMQAEKEKGIPHADIDQIYDYMSSHIEGEHDWERIKKIEIEIEDALLVANQEMQELYQIAIDRGIRVIAVSDMYLQKEQIQLFLQHAGYQDISQIYVSSECKKTKYRKDMFPYVIQQEGILPNEILHIGDNKNDDVIFPRECGVDTIHYDRTRMMYTEGMSLAASVHEGIINAWRDSHSFWYMLGANVGGPIYEYLIKWLKGNLSEYGNRKIFFLARDGYNLYTLLKEQGYSNIEYMYCSRRAMMLASINELNEYAFSLLPPVTTGQIIADVLDYIGLCPTKVELEEAGFASVKDIISSEKEIEKMHKLYKIMESQLLELCAQEREYAQNYLNKIGFMQQDSIVFDCGWNGSSQYLLQHLLEKIGYNKEYVFMYAGIMDNWKSQKQLQASNYHSCFFGIGENVEFSNRVRDSIVLFELFFGAPHGSVLKYTEDGFVLEEIEQDMGYRKEIFSGINDYIGCVNRIYEKYGIDSCVEDALQPLFRLIEQPSEEEAITIGNISNVDGLVAKKEQKKYIANISWKAIHEEHNTDIYWPQGLLVRSDIEEEVKRYVRNRFCLYDTNKRKESLVGVANMNIFQKIKYVKATSGFKGLVRILKNKIRTKGNLLRNRLAKQKPKNQVDVYTRWIKKNEVNILNTSPLSYLPLISIVIPVYNVKENELVECIESVVNQTYDNWELCMVDDASTWDCVSKVLKKYENNPKIHIKYRTENGHISKTTNDAIAMANGEYIAFMDCDDVLAPNAIYEMTKMVNADSSLDFIYSDEDKLSEDGKIRRNPFFKPDWSPDTFMSLMYTCHFSMYRKKIVDAIGGLNVGVEGAQDYDFTLRFTEQTNRIGHIAKILYHWRERPQSIASDPEAKPYALEAIKRLKEEALQRRGLEGEVLYCPDVFQYRVRYCNSKKPLASIVIPSKDNYEIFEKCITSIAMHTEYENYEVIVVDNGSDDENKRKYEELCEKYPFQYVYKKMEFNFSKMCNMGAEKAHGEVLVFLNNDIEIIQNDWLDIMVGHASVTWAGAVGAKLYYPNTDTIQHMGVLNLAIGPSHAFVGFSDSQPYYYCCNRLEYNFSAVTGACVAIMKEKYFEIGGFDEKLPIAYNDVDMCFTLVENGYYNVVRNDVILYHHESISRGLDNFDRNKRKRLEKEREYLYNKHPDFKKKDPFYNKNLVQNKVNYEIG